MADRIMSVRLKGRVPLLMNKPTLVDPTDPASIERRKISSKRKKVLEDHEEMNRIEYGAAIYLNDTVGLYIPAAMLEKCIVEAGKLQRLGTTLKQTMMVLQNEIPVEIPELPATTKKGSLPTVKDFYGDPRFVDKAVARIKTDRVIRCRPIFHKWSLAADLSYDDQEIDTETMSNILRVAGRRIGIGDYRPRYGRFTVTIRDLTRADMERMLAEEAA